MRGVAKYIFLEEIVMNNSKFTGGVLGMLGWDILVSTVSSITAGIALPWLVCAKEKWYAEHTFIDGKQLTFDGKGGQLFGQYIKWLLLTFITCGIYSFWLARDMKRWMVEHTHTVD